jgi:hypothetical protein
VSRPIVMPSFGVVHVIYQLHVFFVFCHKFYQWPNKSPEPTWLGDSGLPTGRGLLFGLVLTWLSFFR